MESDRYRIELHGEGSGLLDTITGRSEPDLLRKLIDKLETSEWFFRSGDTLKLVDSNVEGCSGCQQPE